MQVLFLGDHNTNKTKLINRLYNNFGYNIHYDINDTYLNINCIKLYQKLKKIQVKKWEIQLMKQIK